jgi:hypothetical protein
MRLYGSFVPEKPVLFCNFISERDGEGHKGNGYVAENQHED